MSEKNVKENFCTRVSYAVEDDGFYFSAGDAQRYFVKYPRTIWRALAGKNILAENFVYARTAPLRLATDRPLNLLTNFPFLKKITDYGLKNDLPQIAYTNKISVKNLITKFQHSKVSFGNAGKFKLLAKKKNRENKALLALSFGKDSLLSYGLMKELGIDYQLAYVNEMETSNRIENEHKQKIIKSFCRQENETLVYLKDDADNIFYNRKLPIKIKNFDNTNGMLAFALEFLPLAYYYRAKYLILGNERNLNDHFDYQGFKAYPSFDQSSAYAIVLNKELGQFTGQNYQVASLIESIYNLAEFKILYSRYPHLLPYWMSCDQKMTVKDKWCNNCPMCANAYLYSLAVNEDPRKIGLKHDLLAKKYQALYPLFQKKNLRAYEMPPEVREEQLLAFLLAYQNGATGDLMDIFIKRYLKQAKNREKELRRKFFTVYQAPNVPNQYKTKLLNIFKGELKQFI